MLDLEQRREIIISEKAEWEKQSLWSAFEGVCRTYGDRPFLIAPEKTWTYSQANAKICEIASAMRAFGITKGDHVALLLYSRVEFVFLSLALSAAGCVQIPVNTGIGAYELDYLLEHSDCSWLFSEDTAAVNKSGYIKRLSNCVVFSEKPAVGMTWDAFMRRAGDPDVFLPNPGEPDDVAMIMYTSGSTGFPKGVMITHDMILRRSYASRLSRGVTSEMISYVPLPLFHIFGYVAALWTTITAGAAIIIDWRKFSVAEAAETIVRNHVNEIMCVPQHINKFVEFAGGRRLFPDVRTIYCAAFNCRESVWKDIVNTFYAKEIVTGYGLTETCGAITETDPLDPLKLQAQTVGHRLPAGCSGKNGWQIELAVIDSETERPVPNGTVGEIICRGEIITHGYYRDPENTAKLFTGSGWLKTGDLGILGNDGYIRFIGRVNDQYKINGENVSPQFVDRIIGLLPNVDSVCVVGIPNERTGSVGVAFISLCEDSQSAREELFEHIADSLALFQIPKHYIFWSAKNWPTTGTGKVPKQQMKKLAIAILDGTLRNDAEVVTCHKKHRTV